MGRIEVWWSDTEESRSAKETNNKWVGGRTAGRFNSVAVAAPVADVASRGENNRGKNKR